MIHQNLAYNIQFLKTVRPKGLMHNLEFIKNS
jgi:hypothetical protein